MEFKTDCGGETDPNKPQEQIKTIIVTAAFCVVELCLTFIFGFAASLKSVPLRIAACCAVYAAMAAAVFSACRAEKKSVKDLGFCRRNPHIQILIGIGLAVGLSFIIGALPILIGGPGASLIGGKQTNAANIVYSIATDLIFVGTVEELIFRGFIQTRISGLTNRKWIGVLTAAALFGFWHIVNGSWIQVPFTFLIGCAFGFCRAYLKNCTTASVMLAHGLYDSLLIVIAIVLL
ncbi:MAG: CPBP family intramembrane metalloprotease [Clostridiales bacterium]|jgi:membrane protease YdiL (CAAX protease family)|nr:CPBP family intramembrane metalloprotease [Clostridiales bacterium]